MSSPNIRCCKCQASIKGTEHAIMAGWEWYCSMCAPPVVHPKHERDSGVALRVGMFLLFAAILLGLVAIMGRR